jgi:hypothetical protein
MQVYQGDNDVSSAIDPVRSLRPHSRLWGRGSDAYGRVWTRMDACIPFILPPLAEAGAGFSLPVLLRAVGCLGRLEGPGSSEPSSCVAPVGLLRFCTVCAIQFPQ